ncbi:NUXM, NADH-ubiquinone oxidoreductase subunit [Dendrothele bispora CBS 962.96]|uniref:NUXM, NADH-ubiquinone oxidoreductase subunit n=1 Tax=Dendrothele bispora (strain CBS 962.96) TaxID=1314807 RepID=A0A4S8LBN3_DENBC|nr:NUXM, NADH-ubiquinone oxidoreductase subunit [Dendrothele bispora CBS 962.96]
MPPYPLIDIDPHAARVISYFRPSDYGVWAASTIAVPSALLLWVGDAASVIVRQMVTGMKVGAFIGFCGGFLLAYQRSSKRFWGWTENKREAEMDFAELSQRAKEGKPLYGESDQPEWVQGVAHRNSVFTQLKFSAFPMFNLVNHPYHGTDPAKYGVKSESASEE